MYIYSFFFAFLFSCVCVFRSFSFHWFRSLLFFSFSFSFFYSVFFFTDYRIVSDFTQQLFNLLNARTNNAQRVQKKEKTHVEIKRSEDDEKKNKKKNKTKKKKKNKKWELVILPAIKFEQWPHHVKDSLALWCCFFFIFIRIQMEFRSLVIQSMKTVDN